MATHKQLNENVPESRSKTNFIFSINLYVVACALIVIGSAVGAFRAFNEILSIATSHGLKSTLYMQTTTNGINCLWAIFIIITKIPNLKKQSYGVLRLEVLYLLTETNLPTGLAASRWYFLMMFTSNVVRFTKIAMEKSGSNFGQAVHNVSNNLQKVHLVGCGVIFITVFSFLNEQPFGFYSVLRTVIFFACYTVLFLRIFLNDTFKEDLIKLQNAQLKMKVK